jgi:hypothetical protein
VTPFVRTDLGVEKVMIIVIFTYATLTVSDALPKGRKFNQETLVSTVLPELVQRKLRLFRRKRGLSFLIHMDNAACEDGHKITNKSTAADITHALHPPHSPDLSPCDFWLFGFLKESMKGMELSTENQSVEAKTTIWRGITFDTPQSVFQDWMQRLHQVIENNSEYYFESAILIQN